MRFTINLATQTYIDKRLLSRVCYGLLIPLVLLLGWNVTRAARNQGEKQRLETEIAALESRLNNKPKGIPEKDFTSQQSRILFYNEIITRKSNNWLTLLELVENVTPEGIALSSLAQGSKQGEFSLEGRARTFAALRKYLEALEGSRNFTNVTLLSHRELVTGETGRGIQFALSCKVQY